MFTDSTRVPPENPQPKNKKPAEPYCASGPMSALCYETLCTPHRTRRTAVMMTVAMRPRVHSLKIEKIAFGVNYGFFLALFRGAKTFKLESDCTGSIRRLT
jgi:hypothetical protein